MTSREVHHVNGIPVRTPFLTHSAMTAHELRPMGILVRMARGAVRTARGCVEFVRVYSEYRRHHPKRYAARIAWEIAFKSLPF